MILQANTQQSRAVLTYNLEKRTKKTRKKKNLYYIYLLVFGKSVLLSYLVAMLSLLWLSPCKALLDLISFASKSNYRRFEYYECNNDELNLKSHTLRHDMKHQRARSSRMCVLLLINGLGIMNWCFLSFSLLLKVVKEIWEFTLLHVWRVRVRSYWILACASRFRSTDLV